MPKPNHDMDDVYRQHAQTVYQFLLAQTRDADLAEELTAETFYQAVRSIGRYDGSCKLSVWLCQIAKHLWYRHLQKNKRQTESLSEDIVLCVPSAEEEAVATEDHIALLRAVHALPEPAREVVYLRSFGGLSFRQIGDVLGKSENWARVTFYRGKERLQKGAEQDEK